MTVGPGHVVVYGNPAFRKLFGDASVGLPARETMLDFPPATFALLDAVLACGRPFACWIQCRADVWRMTAMPRVELGTDEVFGVSFHLRARDDLPILVPD
jgi:hypothetical protein